MTETTEEKFDLELHCASFDNSDIYKTILAGDHRKLLKLIYEGNEVGVQETEFGMTYLHLVTMAADSATESSYVPMVHLLSNAGIHVNAKNNEGETALHNAIKKNLEDLMVALFRVGCEFHPIYKSIIQEFGGAFELSLTMWHDKFHPGMWQAVAANDYTTVTRLISYWCRINISNPKYGTLRKYAKSCGASMEIQKVLIEKEATMEVVHAILAGDERRLANLRANNACDLTILDESFQTNFLKPVMPRTLYQTADCMGFQHLLLSLQSLRNETDREHRRSAKRSSQICGLM